jgi:hypothetical protein
MLVGEDGTRVYEARSNAGLQFLFMLGGMIVVLVVVSLTMKSVSRSERPGIPPGVVGVGIIMGVVMLFQGLSLLRGTSRVIIDKDQMRVEGPTWSRNIAWSQIARVRKKAHAPLMGQNLDAVQLIGASGKVLAEIRDSVKDYAELVQQITDRSTLARGEATVDFAADDAAMVAKVRRKLIIIGSVCSLFTMMFGAGAAWGIFQWLHERKYASEGIIIQAPILDRRDHERYPSLRYGFKDAEGRQFKRYVTMEPGAWDALRASKAIGIVYLPSNPNWNRPIGGEHDAGPARMLPFMLFGVVMMGVISIASFLGYQLKLKEGGIKLTRWGKPIGD